MTITVEAVYQNGILKPKQALTFAEGAEVRLTISPM
jgi:predicted DNA-binding antitoxin AbrB/MazE fold protein